MKEKILPYLQNAKIVSILILIVVGLPITLFVLHQQQTFQQRASSSCGPGDVDAQQTGSDTAQVTLKDGRNCTIDVFLGAYSAPKGSNGNNPQLDQQKLINTDQKQVSPSQKTVDLHTSVPACGNFQFDVTVGTPPYQVPVNQDSIERAYWFTDRGECVPPTPTARVTPTPTLPAPTPTRVPPTATPVPTHTPTPVPTATPKPTATSTPKPTQVPTATPTNIPTLTPTIASSPTPTPTGVLACVKPGKVVNVRVECPYCGK